MLRVLVFRGFVFLLEGFGVWGLPEPVEAARTVLLPKHCTCESTATPKPPDDQKKCEKCRGSKDRQSSSFLSLSHRAVC